MRNIETGEVQNIDTVYDQFEYTTFSDGQITPKNSEGGDDLLSTSERETVNAQQQQANNTKQATHNNKQQRTTNKEKKQGDAPDNPKGGH